ncbi:MAG: alcohol dehydrogenase catalytic domain-containing protein, partial [Planctomycetaceae bacterium]|nr:alcohol dehydrogenase catalytic domain-containing protein [Planctomycetaceae bacterium]
MRAVVLQKGEAQFQTDVSPPEPKAGEARVRVLKAGICETDLQLIQGYMGFEGVLGHEFVGIAETGPLAGQRVVGEINCSCRTCEYCKAGLETHCPHRTVLGILNHDGAFADALVLPEVNLHVVPDEIPTELAALTEPVAAAFQIPTQLPLEDFQNVTVLGDGRLGNLCAQVIRLSGCQVRVVGKHPDKLKLFEELGLETIELQNLQPTRTADLVVDCTGSDTGLSLALQLVKPRGTIVLKTTVAGEQTLSLAPFVIDEITLVGSRCGPF